MIAWRRDVKRIITFFFFVFVFFPISTFGSPNCNNVEDIGTVFNGHILDIFNDRVANTQHRINRRKSLKIHRVEYIKFKGCNVKTRIRVTLKRKVRRKRERLRFKTIISSSGWDWKRWELCSSWCLGKSRLCAKTLRKN